MGFWIFMFIMNLLIPLTMVIFGRLFLKKAPSTINYAYGYRTKMSMKNRDTWEFAHKYCGRIWYICGFVLLALTVLVMIFLIGESDDVVGNVGTVICSVQLIPLLGAIYPTEKALRKNFDRDGKRKGDSD